MRRTESRPTSGERSQTPPGGEGNGGEGRESFSANAHHVASRGQLDVLTPLSDCRQESVEEMEQRISGVSYMYWVDFHNGILCCGFLCARLISVSIVSIVALFPATTPHACLFSGHHAKGYLATSIHHGLSRPGLSCFTTTARLSRLCI